MVDLELVLTRLWRSNRFLKLLSGGAGADTFLINLSSAQDGGADADSVSITGSLMGATTTSVLATRTSPSVGATNSSIHGGAGNDTFVVSASNLQTSTTVSGEGNDSVSFTGDLSGGYVLGGSGNDTVNAPAL